MAQIGIAKALVDLRANDNALDKATNFETIKVLVEQRMVLLDNLRKEMSKRYEYSKT